MHQKEEYRHKTLSLAAIFSVVTITAGIAANILPTILSNRIDSSPISGFLEIISAGLGALFGAAIASFVFWRQIRKPSDWEFEEDAAMRRIKIALSDPLRDQFSASQGADLDLSVSLRDIHASAALQRLESSAAFVASLASEPRCTVITGEAGSGKSSLLRYIALQMMEARANDKTRFTPLLLPSNTWGGHLDLIEWGASQSRRIYGIPSEVVHGWNSRGTVVLLLDGLDEIRNDLRPSFISAVNNWLNSPIGGRIIVSCRTGSYLDHFKSINHDQVANLEPLSQEAIRRYFDALISREITDPSKQQDARSLLHNVALASTTEFSAPITPSIVRLYANAVLRATSGATGTDNEEDPGAVAVGLGDSLSRKGDRSAALESYLAALKMASSDWRPLATLRASLLLAEDGNFARARETLMQAVATEIKESIHSDLLPIDDQLSEDERAVLAKLSRHKSLDAFQVSSQSLVPPSRCNSALRQLRERGLVDVVNTQDGEPRFQRSAVELIEQ